MPEHPSASKLESTAEGIATYWYVQTMMKDSGNSDTCGYLGYKKFSNSKDLLAADITVSLAGDATPARYSLGGSKSPNVNVDHVCKVFPSHD